MPIMTYLRVATVSMVFIRVRGRGHQKYTI